jgi:hypothetical protein
LIFHRKSAVEQKQKNQGGEFEYLQLSLEEAFYLAYGLGCLKVLLPNRQEVCYGKEVLEH